MPLMCHPPDHQYGPCQSFGSVPKLGLHWGGSLLASEYAQALTTLRASVSQAPNIRSSHVVLAATYAQMGMMEEAQMEVAKVMRIEPHYTISGIARPTITFKDTNDDQHYFGGLRRAGLPE